MSTKTSTTYNNNDNNGKNFNLDLINVQSLKSKELMLLDYLDSTHWDACILTETWLRDCDEDKIWLEATNLNKGVYKLSISNPSGTAGGKLALLQRTETNVFRLSEGELETFQFARWRLTIPDVSTTIVALYYPPYSVINPVTNAMFTYEFTNWITNILVDDKNSLPMGDLNIHINNEDDPEAMILANTLLQALGLQCHTYPFNYINMAIH